MKRIPELDLLRAVAIILVMLLHAQAFPFTTRMGWAGVDLFFVLSGFLVSGLLFTEYKSTGKLRVGRFLARRGFKIYPAFYFVLILHIVYYAWKGISLHGGQLLAEAFFFQNYQEGLLGISWSLAIEEHFYFLVVMAAIILIVTMQLRSVKTVVSFCITVCILCLAFRYFTYQQYGYAGVFINDFPTHLRIDALAFGLMLSCLYHFRTRSFISFFTKYSWILLLSGFLATLPVCMNGRGTFIVNTIGYTLLYIGFGIVVSLSIVFAENIRKGFGRPGLSLLYRVLAFTGRYSYTIYLCHFLVGTGIVSLTRRYISMEFPHLVYILIYLVSCVIAGVALSLLIEKPFLRIREKYFPVKRENGVASVFKKS